MQIQQKVLLVRAFRQLQEGVLKGLELIDKAGGEEIDRPEDLAELSAHLEQVEAHVRTMRETFDDYAGANSLLGAVAREREENVYPFMMKRATALMSELVESLALLQWSVLEPPPSEDGVEAEVYQGLGAGWIVTVATWKRDDEAARGYDGTCAREGMLVHLTREVAEKVVLHAEKACG